jgi:hypothetical protein
MATDLPSLETTVKEESGGKLRGRSEMDERGEEGL